MKKKSMQGIKENKGFTTQDIVISIVIIMVFVGIITTLFYNFYLSTTAKNRNAIATTCLVDVIEQVKMMEYDQVDQASVSLLIDTLMSNKTIPEGYTITAEVKKYNQTDGNTNKKDIIKILKITVEYIVGQKTQKSEISTLLTK